MVKLNEVLAKHEITDESAIADLEDYISKTLAAKSDNMIPKSRFDEVIEQRNQLKADLSEKDGEVNKLNKNITKLGKSGESLKILEDENKSLKAEVLNIRHEQWKSREHYFTDEEFKEKSDKIRDDFIFPEEDQELTLEQIEKNINAFKPYEKVNYFGIEPLDPDGKKPKGIPPKEYKSPFDVFPGGR